MASKNISKNFTHIYNLIKNGIPPSHIDSNKKEKNSICEKLNLSKQALNYYLSTLKQIKTIEKNKSGIWEIKKELSDVQLKNLILSQVKKKSSRGMKNTQKPITNLHALEIKFPIIEGKIQDSNWQVKNKLKNWLPKYKNLKNLDGLTIRNNNNKSLQIFAKARNIKDLNEVDNLAFKIKTFITEYFKKKYNVILDPFECEIKNINLATEDKQSEGMLGKGEKFELKFDKTAEKIFPKDNIKSKAWMDGSPFKFTAETNDKEWKREYLRMPFSMKNSLTLLYYIAQNYASHVGVVEKLDKLLESPKVKKHIISKVKNSKQTKLGDFL